MKPWNHLIVIVVLQIVAALLKVVRVIKFSIYLE
jgi:hypothetical protein